MAVLTLEHVSKAYSRAGRSFTALEDVSLTVEAGEHVSVWGSRRSGRTTLLRVAAGLEEADSGTVRSAGDGACGFVQASPPPTRERVVDYVAFPLLARGVGAAEAHEQARTQLATVGASSCAELRAGELDAADRVRVGLAQILVRRPQLVLVDEPTAAVDLLEREPLMALLRQVADRGVSVLMTTAEAIGVAGVDRVLTIADGRVRTGVVRAPGAVIPLRRSAG